MAEHIVEHIGFLDIVQLRGLADELPGRKPAVRQMFEKNRIRHQRGHRHHAPSGELFQIVGELLEIGNAARTKRKLLQAIEEFAARPPLQHLGLPIVQRAPNAVLGRAIALPVLVDGEIGPDLGMAFPQLFERRHASRSSCANRRRLATRCKARDENAWNIARHAGFPGRRCGADPKKASPLLRGRAMFGEQITRFKGLSR